MADSDTTLPKPLSLDAQLCFALYAATNAVVRAYRPKLEAHGLTYPQYLVLLVLWQDGSRPIGQIAARLRLPPNAVTPLLGRLDAAGLITRRRDPDDGRVIHVHLTEAGTALEREVSLLQQDVVCETGLEPAALDALREELRALVRQMEGGS